MPEDGAFSDLLGSAEVAQLLQITQTAVRKLYYRGTLPAIRRRHMLFFKRSAVLALKSSPDYQKSTRRQRGIDTETPSLLGPDVTSGAL